MPDDRLLHNLSREASKHLADVCQQFDSDLRSGRDVQISDYLAELPGVTSDLLLQELLITYLEFGLERDPEFDYSHLYSQFPEHLPIIQEAVKLAVPLQQSAEDLLKRPDGMPLMVGHYRLEKLIGRGAFGVVFLATDVETEVEVAIKIPQVPALFDPRARERFLHEAAAEAKLDHPNIVKLLEVGTEDPVCYLASEYIDGPTLTDWLRSQSSEPIPIEDAVRFLISLCDPVSHAHERGVHHLDLSPQNLLLKRRSPQYHSEYKTFRLIDFQVMIADFGMSRIVGKSSQYSTSGILAGTLSYMAPEQATGHRYTVDHRADIYALGAILYLLFTNRAPFQSVNMQELLLLAHRGYPDLPDRWREDLPEPLVSICMKCLEKDPGRRYKSVNQLSMDLQKFLAGRRPATRNLQYQRWRWWYCQNPTRGNAIVSAIAMMCLVFVLTIYGIYLILDSNKSLQLANASLMEESNKVRARDLKLRQQAYAAGITRSATLLDIGEVVAAKQLLAQFLPQPGETDLRGSEWHLLQHRTLPAPHRVLTKFPHAVTAVAYAPRGDLIAVGGVSKIVRLIDPRDGTQLYPALPHTGEIETLSFSPDGKILATGSSDGRIRLWQPGSTQPLRDWHAHPDRVQSLDWSPDGKRLASGGKDATVRLWYRDSDKGKLLSTFGLSVRTVKWTPDGKAILAASDKNLAPEGCTAARLLDPETGEDRGFIPFEGSIVLAAHFMGQDQLILSLRSGRLEYLKKDKNGKWILSHHIKFDSPRINDMVASSFGSQILVCQDGSATLITENGQKKVMIYPESGARIWTGAISPLGDELVTAGADGDLLVWPIKTAVSGPEVLEHSYSSSHRLSICPFPDNPQVILNGSKDAMLFSLDRTSRVPPVTCPTRGKSLFGMFDASGAAQLLMEDFSILPFDRNSLTPDKLDSIDPNGIEGVQSVNLVNSPDAKHALWLTKSRVNLLDIMKKKQQALDVNGIVSRITFPDNEHILLSCNDRTLRVLSIDPLREVRIVKTPTDHLYHYATLARDGSLAATAEAVIQVWGPDEEKPRFRLVGHAGQITAIAFAPDCKTLLSAGVDGTLRFWRLDTGYEVLRIELNAIYTHWLHFSPDGRFLMATSAKKNVTDVTEIRIFDLRN